MLNKRECRKFADPCMKLNLRSGIMNASQVDFVVCAAVKVIDRHKTLVLWLYPREKAAQGDFKPCMTIFHSTDDFITLSSRDEGKTVWHTAAFNRLDNDWSFHKKCAFYSQKDEACVTRYFKSDTGGFMPLVSAQDAILEHRRMERQRSKEKSILNRMAGIPALPRGLKG